MIDSKVLDRVLAASYPRWKAWLRLRHSQLAHLHAEIVQDTATNLTEFSRTPAFGADSDDDLLRIGFKILRNRTADAYRSKTSNWYQSLSPDDLPSSSPSSQPDAGLRYGQIMRWVVGYISRLDRADRELILRKTDLAPSDSGALSTADRQRLSRLRARMRHDLLTEHGVDLRKYLKED